ncbi:MAG: RNA polymerase sigma factor [Candidatus Thiodiazotropha sp.]
MSQWRDDTNLRTWLFTIMHNLYVNGVRRSKRQGGWGDYDPHHTPDPRQTGQESMIQMRDLELALSKLSDYQREILMLVCVEGLRYEAVAEILGIPQGTVMSRLHRARDALRRTLEGGEPMKLRGIK